jgi:hypothetical protein
VWFSCLTPSGEIGVETGNAGAVFSPAFPPHEATVNASTAAANGVMDRFMIRISARLLA